MDNKRIVLWGAVGALLWWNLITWQRDYPEVAAATSSSASSAASLSTELPSLPSSAGSSSAAAAVASPMPAVATESLGSDVHVITDVLDLHLNTLGGDIDRVDLLKYSVSKDQPNDLVTLLNTDPATQFVVHSGLLASEVDQAPTHQATFQSAANDYHLRDGQDELSVTLTWTNGQGVTVNKTYLFKRGSYAVQVKYDVTNVGNAPWQAASYVQLFRHDLPVKYSMTNASSIAYRGPAVFDGKAYRKLKVKNEEDAKFKSTITGGWMAALQHHFVVAAVPAKDQVYDYDMKTDNNNDFTFTYRGPLQTVAAGAKGEFDETLFIGPKLQSQLAATGNELERTTDFGKLYLIAQPLFWLLNKVHSLVRNWGIAIIVVTILIKLAFYKLTASSGRSMAKMRTLSPKIKALQERYKDDREALGRATMELYKKEKINPVAGCLPMLIQIPFFMGFYWVLLESVEMRQAPFFGWINDLSSRDPYFILPIIMGAANFMQFKMNPPNPDPTQQKIMMFMPIMMTVMMAWFPAGLVLYWITNTSLSALQQWRINKLIATDTKA
jgi:YidC/Oxa1 family membrane protein insertase